MPDTGAPWNIPFVTPTDNPRLFPAADEAQALAIAAGLTAAGSPGIGPNVVQTAKLDTFTTTSATFTTVTGLTATITPTELTSKILVIVQLTHGLSNNGPFGHFKVTRGGTDIYRGDASGSRVQAVFGGFFAADARDTTLSASMVYLDSPNDTSPVTYQVEARRGPSGTAFINRGLNDNDSENATRGASSITVIEVQA